MRHLILFFAFAFAMSVFSENSVEVTTTTANGQILLKTQRLELGSTPGTANSIITLNADKKYQTMDGFGFALTYSACYNLMKMTAQDRHNLLFYEAYGLFVCVCVCVCVLACTLFINKTRPNW